MSIRLGDPWDDAMCASYDAWKTRSPDDEYQEECCHEDYEINYEGRAECGACGESWWASTAEIEAQRAQQVEYDRWCRKQERREFWLRITRPIRWPIFRLLERVWPRKSLAVLSDEEIPF